MEDGKAGRSGFKSAAVLKTKAKLLNRITIRYIEDGAELRAKRSFQRPSKPLFSPISRPNRYQFPRKSAPNSQKTPSLPEDELERFIPEALRGLKRVWKYRGASHTLARKDVFDSSEIAFWSIRNKSPL